MKRTLVSLAMIVLLMPIAAGAQTNDPGFFDRLQPGTPVADRVGCTWQWAQHTIGPWGGWYHACAAPQRNVAPPLTELPAPDQHVCQGINPYADPAAMMACLAVQPPPPQPERQRIVSGRIYDVGYPGRRVMVLSVVAAVGGVEVVTYQWLVADSGVRAPGDVDACRNDDGLLPTSCKPMVEVR